MAFAVELPDKITPEEAEPFIMDDQWVVQEKRNGKHRVIARDGNQIVCFNRDGIIRPISRKFEYVLLNEKLPDRFVIDIEEESKDLIILDVLTSGGRDFIPEPYITRLQEADTYHHVHPQLQVIRSIF